MHIEPIAVALLSVLLFAGYLARSTVTVALFASLPFGATAFATLTAMGGASLVLFTPLAGLLIATTLGRKSALRDLRTVLTDKWVAALVVFLVIYVVAGALMLTVGNCCRAITIVSCATPVLPLTSVAVAVIV